MIFKCPPAFMLVTTATSMCPAPPDFVHPDALGPRIVLDDLPVSATDALALLAPQHSSHVPPWLPAHAFAQHSLLASALQTFSVHLSAFQQHIGILHENGMLFAAAIYLLLFWSIVFPTFNIWHKK